MLLEKEQIPRYKVCGGGVTLRTLRLLPRHVSSSVEQECARVEVHLAHRGRSLVVQRPGPLIFMVMRQHFDQALVEAAKNHGAEIMPNTRLLGVEEYPGHLVLHTTQGDISARFLVGADGALSTVARSLGFGPSNHMAPALQVELGVSSKQLLRYQGTARFDLLFVPQGYAWVFPKKNSLSVGVGRMRPGKINLHNYLKDYLSFTGLASGSALKIKGSVVPVRPRKGPLAQGRTLLVGDAAGLADPLTGEGIYHAVTSGALAAKAVVRGMPVAGKITKIYEKLLRAIVLKDLRWARLAALWFYGNRKVAETIFALYGRRLCETMADIISGKGTYRKALVSPFTYMRLRPVLGEQVKNSIVDNTGPLG